MHPDVKELIDQFNNPSLSKTAKKNALKKASFVAMQHGDSEGAEELYKQGCLFRSPNAEGDHPITIAAINGHLGCVQFLIKKKVTIYKENSSSMLKKVVEAGRVDCLYELIDYTKEKGFLTKFLEDHAKAGWDSNLTVVWQAINKAFVEKSGELLTLEHSLISDPAHPERLKFIDQFEGHMTMVESMKSLEGDLGQATVLEKTYKSIYDDARSITSSGSFKPFDVIPRKHLWVNLIEHAGTRGDIDYIARLIDQGLNLEEFRSCMYDSILYYATRAGKVECAKWLVDTMGVSVQNTNALKNAFEVGSKDLVVCLIDHLVTKFGESALPYDFMDLILRSKGILDKAEFTSWMLENYGSYASKKTLDYSLAAASYSGDVNLVKVFWEFNPLDTRGLSFKNAEDEEGAFLEVEDNIDLTIGVLSAGSAEVVKFYLDKGFSANFSDISNRSLLMQAAYREDLESVKLLVKNGADVHAIDRHGNTVLDYLQSARWHSNRLEMIEYLMQNGATVNLEKLTSITDDAPVKTLLKHGLDADACLHEYARPNKPYIPEHIQELIAYGANPATTKYSKNGAIVDTSTTVVKMAPLTNHPNFVYQLLEHGHFIDSDLPYLAIGAGLPAEKRNSFSCFNKFLKSIKGSYVTTSVKAEFPQVLFYLEAIKNICVRLWAQNEHLKFLTTQDFLQSVFKQTKALVEEMQSSNPEKSILTSREVAVVAKYQPLLIKDDALTGGETDAQVLATSFSELKIVDMGSTRTVVNLLYKFANSIKGIEGMIYAPLNYVKHFVAKIPTRDGGILPWSVGEHELSVVAKTPAASKQPITVPTVWKLIGSFVGAGWIKVEKFQAISRSKRSAEEIEEGAQQLLKQMKIEDDFLKEMDWGCYPIVTSESSPLGGSVDMDTEESLLGDAGTSATPMEE